MTINVETTIDGNNIRNHFDVKHRLDESIHDFHFFCLSVVKDLITGQHKLDQFGEKKFTYPFEFDEDDIDNMIIRLEYMANIMIRERLKKKKSFDNLINDN